MRRQEETHESGEKGPETFFVGVIAPSSTGRQLGYRLKQFLLMILMGKANDNEARSVCVCGGGGLVQILHASKFNETSESD